MENEQNILPKKIFMTGVLDFCTCLSSVHYGQECLLSIKKTFICFSNLSKQVSGNILKQLS